MSKGNDTTNRKDTGSEETRETVLADVRAHCKLLKDAGFDGDSYDILVLVERLDAAWKREYQFRDVTKMVGNAAKLRDALAALVDYWNWGGYDAGRILRLQDDARAAITAPPRNCDRFATKEEAWNAFAHAYFGPTDPGFIEDAFERWLFAPAAQKGGTP